MFDIPSVEPSDTFCKDVSHVVLEGQLLEVSISEVATIWKFQQTLREYKRNKLELPPPKAPKKASQRQCFIAAQRSVFSQNCFV